MGLKTGQILSWEEIESCIRRSVVPSDLPIICESCSWRSLGFARKELKIFRREGITGNPERPFPFTLL
ncbi:DUF1284 domain-containing protein [Neobacillus citreus]|uniref:DUF1284 domain-containing protein n=1 Tax=Neobacillus citreus TaxID=2833578 RepID=A0A9J6MTC9_9BACI|nr:DUF1284 domain-containing protein [Neobacillus citreus]MCH6267149.1 DUF1284 domain-containing protein [Neobacillus citreus]